MIRTLKKSASLVLLVAVLFAGISCSNSKPEEVSQEVMKQVYEKVKTPYKYGLVLVPEHQEQQVDCRSVFRSGDRWYMTYIVYEGRGYETWLAESQDLVNWTKKGRILSLSDSTRWDANQNSGDVVLRDHTWGGSYRVQQYQDKYWMSYYGGTSTGYEAGKLSISIAYTEKDPSIAHEWTRLGQPVLDPDDDNASWWDEVGDHHNRK
jgi:beta-xylosidase